MRWRLIVSVLGLVVLGCAPEELSSAWTRIEPRLAAPEFTLLQLDEGPVSLSEYRGRVVLMEFWATWCGPCRFSTPSLEAIYRRYRDRGVSVLLINEMERPDEIRRWAEGRFTAPILLDQDSQVAQRYGVQGIPRLFIVDQEGQLAYTLAGYGGGLERGLKRILDELLAQPSTTTSG